MSFSEFVAAFALVASFAAIVISIWMHRDSAGRVNVRMNATSYVPFAGTAKLYRNTTGTFKLDESAEPSVEMCQVVIENPGRVGVTVTDVELRIEGIGQKYSVTPRIFHTDGFDGQHAESKTFFRLEPYDRKNLLLDCWSIIDSTFVEYPSLSEIAIHAEVTVAGRRFPFHSKKHGYWRIKREHVSFVNSHTIRRPRNIIVTELLRSNSPDLAKINGTDQFAWTFEDTSDPSWDFDRLSGHVEALIKNGQASDYLLLSEQPFLYRSAIFNVWQQYDRLGSNVVPFPVNPHRESHYKRLGLTPRTELNDGTT
jgi:hypothetical protein